MFNRITITQNNTFNFGDCTGKRVEVSTPLDINPGKESTPIVSVSSVETAKTEESHVETNI
jgi:hypothetical protein